MTAEVMPNYEVPTDIKDEDIQMYYKLLQMVLILSHSIDYIFICYSIDYIFIC